MKPRRRVYDTTSHRNLRAQYRCVVERGDGWCTEVICLNPHGRWIPPGTPWDLAHDIDGSYLGPAHARCNRSEGARRGNRRRSRWW
jgi:hypothetical protein